MVTMKNHAYDCTIVLMSINTMWVLYRFVSLVWVYTDIYICIYICECSDVLLSKFIYHCEL